MQKHYRENRDAYLEKARVRNARIKRENREKILEYLRANPCVDCGISDVRVLEFDHVHGQKISAVSSMLTSSWRRIAEEVAKCEVRCANCHVIKTGLRASWWWTTEPVETSSDTKGRQAP